MSSTATEQRRSTAPTIIITDEWVSLSRASTLLNVSLTTVRNLVDRGELTVRRLPGSHPKVLAADLWSLSEKYVSGPAAARRV